MTKYGEYFDQLLQSNECKPLAKRVVQDPKLYLNVSPTISSGYLSTSHSMSKVGDLMI